MTPLDAAQGYEMRKMSVLPIRAGEKRPDFAGWQDFRVGPDDLHKYFNGSDQNIGVLLGAPSNGLVRIDLDCPEAIAVAPTLLPGTDLILGRTGNPRNGYFYCVIGDLGGSKSLKDPIGLGKARTLVEALWTGKQTLVPPSTHPDGGTYYWEQDGEPADIEAEALVKALNMVAAAALVARYWPDGARHDAILWLAGGLLTDGMSVESAESFIRAVVIAAGDDEVNDRLRAFQDTAQRVQAGQEVANWGKLADLIDRRVLNKVRVWLDLRTTQAGQAGKLRTSDLGNAERLIARHGHDLRYCEQWGSWLEWNGRVWKVVGHSAVKRRAIETVRSIYQEAVDATDSNDKQALAAWAINSESERRISAMVSLAAAFSEVAVETDDLDADRWLLNVKNGTVDLQTGDLREHDRDDLITKLAPVVYDAKAECPAWEAFLARVQPNEEMRDFLRRAVGYSATGDTRERAMFVALGSGANGKSTFLDGLAETLGDYAQQVPSQTLLARKYDGVPNDIARLVGVRFATAVETDEGKRLAEAQIKQLTGDRRVTARFMRENFFEYTPQCKLWLATNHKPLVRGTDKGIWDRLKLIDFPIRIPEAEWDRTLHEKLAAERPGMLAWVVRGCLEWQAQGLGVPASVRNATGEYQEEMDVLRHYLEERCEVGTGEDFKVKAPELYGDYAGWCKNNGEFALSRRALKPRLEERGFKVERGTANQRFWHGLKLVPIDGMPGGR